MFRMWLGEVLVSILVAGRLVHLCGFTAHGVFSTFHMCSCRGSHMHVEKVHVCGDKGRGRGREGWLGPAGVRLWCELDRESGVRIPHPVVQLSPPPLIGFPPPSSPTSFTSHHLMPMLSLTSLPRHMQHRHVMTCVAS